ncbi:MAG: hypothetical protein ACI4QM_04335 [Alphaproteobacteria bacterium]
MHSIKSLITKTINMPLGDFGILMTLMLTALVKSAVLVLLTAGAVGVYLGYLQMTYMAFMFILSSGVLAIIGYYKLLFERRNGYGSVPLCAVLPLILSGLIWLIQVPQVGSVMILFLFAVAGSFLLNASFWTVAARFVSSRLDSRKFAAVFCADLFGYAVAGWGAFAVAADAESALIGSLLMMTICVALLKILITLNPMPRETFVRKFGGASDAAGKRLIGHLFFYDFLCMAAKSILLFAFCSVLAYRPDTVSEIALMWGLFGSLGVLMVLLLYRTGYLYATLLGVLIFAVSFIIGAAGVIMDSLTVLMAAVILSMLMNHFYVQHFFVVLPRPLAVGRMRRVKWRRLMVVEPMGLLSAGVVLFYLDFTYIRALLLVLSGIVLAVSAVLLVKLYSAILAESFKRRQWREGPLMIASPNLLKYMLDHLKSTDADEVIYFIRILGIAKHPAFQKNLVKLLKHPSEKVRLFALGRIERLYPIGSFYKTVEMVMQKDKSSAVRAQALALLMQCDYAVQGEKGVRKYMRNLNDKQLQDGVLKGLLKIGGNTALLAMDTLQRLAFSPKINDSLRALRLIEQVPLSGLVRLVEPLMKHPDDQVAKQALLTAGAMRHPELLSAVFEALDEFDLQETALVALERYGKQAFPPLEKMLHNPLVPAMRQKTLILFLNRLPSGEGKQILLRAVTADNQKLRKSVIQGLLESGIVWIHKNKKALLTKALNKDVERVHFELDFIENQTQAPTHETEEALLFLRRAIIEDIHDTRELVLLQLQLLKPHPLFIKAVRILLSDKTDQYEAALGGIQDFLPHRLYQKIKPIALLPIAPKKISEEKIILESTLAETLNNLLLKSPFALPAWIKATVLYCLRRLGAEEGKPAVIAALNDKNPLVLEAAIWALVRLEKDENTLHNILLNLPTSRLAGQSLEQILES